MLEECEADQLFGACGRRRDQVVRDSGESGEAGVEVAHIGSNSDASTGRADGPKIAENTDSVRRPLVTSYTTLTDAAALADPDTTVRPGGPGPEVHTHA